MARPMFKISMVCSSAPISPFAPTTRRTLACVALVSSLAAACQQKAAPEPAPTPKPASAATVAETPATPAPAKPTKPASRLSPPDDPAAGQFSIEDATAGLAGTGPLEATIETDLGTLSCKLYEKEAPITVANFVGLARGVRPWKKGGEWVKTPLYDGTVFHRVVKGFMIQGGDPDGNGSGGPGYMIKNEIIPSAKHERGILSMARRPDPDSAGSQFFLMDGRAPHLDGGYAIFGKCGPDATIEKLASVPVQGEQSVTPTKIKSVKISRGS
jgi:peptidyl-prolyl cis-trans isomerase A (cyclophilin A)